MSRNMLFLYFLVCFQTITSPPFIFKYLVQKKKRLLGSDLHHNRIGYDIADYDIAKSKRFYSI